MNEDIMNLLLMVHGSLFRDHQVPMLFVLCGYLSRSLMLKVLSLSRYKAHLVANSRSQQQGIDCDETFSPVVKPATIITVLSLAISRHWPIHQVDVKNPSGFRDAQHPDYVCHLQQSLYALKQAPRAWYQRFTQHALHMGFQHSLTDSSLFIYHHGHATAYLLLYVDDIILTASSMFLLQSLIDQLSRKFAMTDCGALNYFLRISATRSSHGLFLSQRKYASEILECAHMLQCNPACTPAETTHKLDATGPPVAIPQPRRHSSVSHHHPSEHRLCGSADLFVHA
ncbi:hypothetical protein LXL04_015569 [Taraxacum kok-saghyz]